MTRIGTSDLDVFPLALGGNVFGWTADRDASFEILDAFHGGGGDFIDTAEREKTAPRFGMRDRDGAYVFPTADNPTDDIEAQIAGIAKKLNKVPFEQIGQDVHRTLTTLDATLKQTEQLAKTVNSDLAPQMKETLAEARRTLDSARQVFSDDAPLQRNARDTLEQVAKAAASVRVLTDYLDRHPEALIRGKAKDAQ